MDTPISREVHEEFGRRIEEMWRRIEDENKRQNRRIDLLEESTKQIGTLAASVQKLALSIESMVKEQEKQGREQEKHEERLETLESRDGEMWRKMVAYVLTAVVGIVIGFIFNQIGM